MLYHTWQFNFAQDGRTASHLCTSYRRTCDSLSHTNPASTLVSQHHSYQALFVTHRCLQGVFPSVNKSAPEVAKHLTERKHLYPESGSLARYILLETQSTFPLEEFFVYGSMLFWRIKSFGLAYEILNNQAYFVKPISIRIIGVIEGVILEV